MKVPFKPDGKRPVFCAECLKEYRRQQSKLQGDLTEQSFVDKNKKQVQNKDSLGDMIKKAMEEK